MFFYEAFSAISIISYKIWSLFTIRYLIFFLFSSSSVAKFHENLQSDTRTLFLHRPCLHLQQVRPFLLQRVGSATKYALS